MKFTPIDCRIMVLEAQNENARGNYESARKQLEELLIIEGDRGFFRLAQDGPHLTKIIAEAEEKIRRNTEEINALRQIEEYANQN